MILRREINLYKAPNDSNLEKEPIFESQIFAIEEPGIYTIEGPNQSGKSVLIKLLVGALPPYFDKKTAISPTWLNDKPVCINSVIDAIDYGIIAVFQEETLLPSMTVKEQILMRHSNPKIRVLSDQFIGRLWNEIILNKIKSKVTMFPTPNWELVEYKYREMPSAQVVSALQSLLTLYGHPDIMNKLPVELSSGQKAIVRLISAQLYKNINILFLDEVLANIDNDTRKKIISIFKTWSETNIGKTIVVVTHNNEEKLLWEPKKEFKIKNGRITSSQLKNHSSVHPSLPKKHDTIPIYKCPYPEHLQLGNDYIGQSFIITSDNIASAYSGEIDRVKLLLKTLSKSDAQIICVPGGEYAKDHQNMFPTIEKILCCLDSKNKLGIIASVGGGSILNFGGFITSILFRGSGAYIMVPTNLTSLADVVIGSKTSINYKTKNGDCFKNAIGVYSDPTAILIDHSFFRSISSIDRRLGLVECLKHGLLQDKDLYSKAYKLIINTDPNIDECIKVAEQVLKYKADVLSRHPWETEGGRILRYGHVFAHALERVSKFAIPHSLSVLWGILLELNLAGNATVFKEIETLMMEIKKVYPFDLKSINASDFIKELNKETYYPIEPYPAIGLSSIGQYSYPNKADVVEEHVYPDQIKKAFQYISKCLSD